KRWRSWTAPASSTTAVCSSKARPRRLSPTRRCARSISAKASASSAMAIGPRLDLRHSQQLVMTPQLQQAIKLLALPNLELESYITGELERNPLLEAAGESRSEEHTSE